MFDIDNPLVQFKLEILRKAMPARDAVVFGDMYLVDGAYTQKCVELGCQRALLVDTLETAAWLEARLKHPALDFYKGDFANPLFMSSITERFEIGVMYEVLLHQATLLGALHLMLDKVTRRACIVQPMLRECETPGSVVYLPGNLDASLHPYQGDGPWVEIFDARNTHHGQWIWGMTPSFLRAALKGEGFEVIHEDERQLLPNPRWFTWGIVAERAERVATHWSTTQPTPGFGTW